MKGKNWDMVEVSYQKTLCYTCDGHEYVKSLRNVYHISYDGKVAR